MFAIIKIGKRRKEATVKIRQYTFRSGQALVELAIFGAIFVMILGALLNYGIRYNLQQEASMTAFRRALRIASDQNKGTGSYMIMGEDHIPDVTDTYGLGSKTTIAASASVTRDYQLDAQPDDADSLPSIVMDIQSNRSADGIKTWKRRVYKNAGFRIEYNVPVAALDKYKAIYGGSSLAAFAGNDIESGPIPGHPQGDPSGWSWVSVNSNDAQRVCLSGSTENIFDGDGNVTGTVFTCNNWALRAVRIVDSCVGQSIDYTSCYKQARQLVDVDYCVRIKNEDRVTGDDTDYNSVCAQYTNPPNQNRTSRYNSDLGGAWYADNYDYENCVLPGGTPDRCYTFPILADLFAFSDGHPDKSSMGLQNDSTSTTSRTDTFERHEDNAGISTSESSILTEVTNKTMISQENLNSSGYEIPHPQADDFVNVLPEDMVSVFNKVVDEEWQTNK